MKDPLFVDALFVKKPERLETLGYVLLWRASYTASRNGACGGRGAHAVAVAPGADPPYRHARIRNWQGVHIARDGTTGARVIAWPAIDHPTLEVILEALQMSATVFTEPP